MNCMKVTLIFALCLAAGYATLCTDQCNGSCDIAKTACDTSVVLGPICTVAYGSCVSGCGTVCGCVDGCNATCTATRNSCVDSASSVLSQTQCAAEYDLCMVDCQAVCTIRTIADAVTALIGMGLGGLGGSA